MLGQATSRGQVLQGLQQHGVAPGGRVMMDQEDLAYQWSNETGIYSTWRNRKNTDCCRVGPKARCFCGHAFAEHSFATKKSYAPRCNSCMCQQFQYIPQRPEEVGDWWLPRRKGFNVLCWRAKCKCGHGHDEHDPTTRRCRCGCAVFMSDFACIVCDTKWEDHETVFESTQERIAGGRPVGDAYRPLAGEVDIQQIVFPPSLRNRQEAPSTSTRPSQSIRPAQVKPSQGEKSVQIMAASSGGAIKNDEVLRWGKVANPPDWPEPLMGLRGQGAIASPSAQAQKRLVAGGGPPTSLSSPAGPSARPGSSAVDRRAYGAAGGAGSSGGQLSSGFKPVYD